jgi:lipoprotein-anchoring transpeptidase ErfK/SrfK
MSARPIPLNLIKVCTALSLATAISLGAVLSAQAAPEPTAPATAAPTLPSRSSLEQTLLNTPGNILPPLDEGSSLPEVPPTPEAVTNTVRLILKRSERRVYVYEGEKVISSYRVAVGKSGWETPLGTFKVLTMEHNPIFKSFKTGNIIEPGPDNPLGVRWIGIWTNGKTQLGFHGTDQPELIGQAVSHGCIRMHNKDVTKLYDQVTEGTVVTIVP